MPKGLANVMTALTEQRTQLQLPPEPASVPAGRHFVCAILTSWGLQRVNEVAELIVSELLTNAIRYAATTVQLSMLVRADVLTVTVTDARPELPPAPLCAGDGVASHAEGGRGLTLVDALSSGWGVRRGDHHKDVWFTLPVAV